MNQNIKVGYGKVTFAMMSGSWLATEVSIPFNRAVLKQGGHAKVGPTQVHPATHSRDINGGMYSEQYTVPDGTLIMVQAQIRARGSRLREGSIFVRTRTDGPALMVKARMISDPNSLLSKYFVVFEGRGDILTEEEWTMWGITPSPAYKQAYLDEDEIAECFEVVSLGGKSAPKPQIKQVVTKAGVQAVAIPAETPRRLRLQRKPT